MVGDSASIPWTLEVRVRLVCPAYSLLTTVMLARRIYAVSSHLMLASFLCSASLPLLQEVRCLESPRGSSPKSAANIATGFCPSACADDETSSCGCYGVIGVSERSTTRFNIIEFSHEFQLGNASPSGELSGRRVGLGGTVV